ncbi:hypothetical protein QAD02_012844 [Eretmocerus hayati]|uniref:Uncharacterized protein n=1 Tax=Eretmocerus hayati TaxID=131215 RepID=A0ACC2P110_9HYME|nr:hypothetical protein QAD02_012844 [Eretmocerus hayati]
MVWQLLEFYSGDSLVFDHFRQVCPGSGNQGSQSRQPLSDIDPNRRQGSTPDHQLICVTPQRPAAAQQPRAPLPSRLRVEDSSPPQPLQPSSPAQSTTGPTPCDDEDIRNDFPVSQHMVGIVPTAPPVSRPRIKRSCGGTPAKIRRTNHHQISGEALPPTQENPISLQQPSQRNNIITDEPAVTCFAPQIDHNIVKELLLKFCITNQLDFSQLLSPISQKLFHYINPSISVPSPDHFTLEIIPRAIRNLEKKLKSADFLNCAIIQGYAEDIPHKMYGFLVTSKGFYFNLDFSDLGDQRIEELEDCEIEDFADNVVEKALQRFNIIIKYVMLDGLGLKKSTYLDDCSNEESDAEVGTDQGPLYFCSFRDLLCELKNFKPRANASMSEMQQYTEYCSFLRKIEQKINSPSYSLGEAVQDFMLGITDKTLLVNPDATTHLENFLTPLHLASNYFHPKLRGTTFESYVTWKKKLVRFVLRQLRGCGKETWTALGEYKSAFKKATDFGPIFSEAQTAEEFWDMARMISETLSDFATSLIRIPAASQVLKSREIDIAFEKLSVARNVSTQALISSIIMNQE